jgi:hypothetical protein
MKDPAMLWYWSDWGGGTRTFSRFLKGCYIDLLEAQFNSGPLSLEEIKIVLASDFGQSWPTLSKKFKQTAQGLFFNERMEVEKAKRVAFSESRRNNRKGNKTDMNDISKTYDKDMSQHMDNDNENTIDPKNKGGKGDKFLIPTIEEVKSYCLERNNSVDPEKWIDFYTAKGWMIGKNKMKDWKAAVRTWEEPKLNKNGTNQISFEQSIGPVRRAN